MKRTASTSSEPDRPRGRPRTHTEPSDDGAGADIDCMEELHVPPVTGTTGADAAAPSVPTASFSPTDDSAPPAVSAASGSPHAPRPAPSRTVFKSHNFPSRQLQHAMRLQDMRDRLRLQGVADIDHDGAVVAAASVVAVVLSY